MRSFALVLLTVACSNGDHARVNDDTDAAAGGNAGASGSSQGGQNSSGGNSTSGGATSNGGGGTGGRSSGGTSPNGGGTSTGGMSSSGGTNVGGSGGTPPSSGGMRATGGHKATGGVPNIPTGTSVPSVSGSAAPVPGTWRNITPTAIDPSMYANSDVVFDPSTPSTLYALFGDGGGLWRSTDSGANWAEIGPLPKPNSLGRVLVDPNDPTHLYLLGSVTLGTLGFWISHDGGKTFKVPDKFQAGATAGTWNMDVYNIATDPTDFNHFVLSFHSGWSCCGDASGVVESMDGGDTFIVHAPPASGSDHGNGIAILYDTKNNIGNANTWLLGAGYGPGMFRTTDAGKSWTKISDLQQNHGGFDLHYSSQGFVFIGATDGVYRSTDNGVTFVEEKNGVPSNYYYSVIGDGKSLYSAAAYVGQPFNTPFVVSPEGGPKEGEVWTKYNDQTFGEGPFKMVFDSKNRIIYAAMWGSGAWALTVK
jgi:hypothetical protein